MRIVARGGHKLLIFSKAAWGFRELNALLASTNRTASNSSAEKAKFMACIAALIPAI